MKIDSKYSHSIVKAAEVTNLSTEDEVAKLSEGQEDDEKHDSKTSQILSTASQGGGQLSHGLVEADVLEYLIYRKQSS